MYELQPNSERKPLEETTETTAMDDEDLIDQPVKTSKRTEEPPAEKPGSVLCLWVLKSINLLHYIIII